MENIEASGGVVTLNISGSYTPQELRELFRRLSQAHAAATGEAMNGHPLYAFGGAVPVSTGYGAGRVFVAINAPCFGWIRAELGVARAEELAQHLQGCIDGAKGAKPQPQH